MRPSSFSRRVVIPCIAGMMPAECDVLQQGRDVRCGRHQVMEKKKNRSDITPDPGGHRPQRPCAPGRTRAKQDQAQESDPGQNQTRSVGGATTHGRRTRQAGESAPTQTRSGARGCILQTTHQAGTPRQDPNAAPSCAKGAYGPGQLQGRAGTIVKAVVPHSAEYTLATT